MNKIILNNDELAIVELNDELEVKYSKNDFLNIYALNIKILNDTDLELEYSNDSDKKIEVIIDVIDNVRFNLYEKKSGCKLKVQYVYNLNKYSSVNIYKFNDINEVNEANVANLNGEYANLNMFMKTIAKNVEKYDVRIYHNASFSKSNIKNYGVVIQNGVVTFNVSSFVLNNIIDCDVNQDNRIINFTNNKCTINPNLFIEENDVVANHSAYIRTFTDDEIFYLQSRGIDINTAKKLLTKGFILSEFEPLPTFQYLSEVIEKYWG